MGPGRFRQVIYHEDFPLDVMTLIIKLYTV